MFFYPVIYQTQEQVVSKIQKAGFGMKDSLNYQALVQPQSDTQYYILVIVGGIALTLIACFYIYNKFPRREDNVTTRENRDSEEDRYDIREIKERFTNLEKRFDAEFTKLWEAHSKSNDKLLDIYSLTGEIKGIVSSRKVDRG
jgi:flagellar motility protein MotE (MotC chaperone)